MSTERRVRGGCSVAAALLGGLLAVGLGYAFTISAWHVWRGTVAAITTDGIPGTAENIRCARKVCSGSFASDDGTVRLDRVAVAMGKGEKTGRGALVRAIDMGPVDGPNSTDTVYLDGTRPVVIGYVLLALLLTFCALFVVVPFLLFAVGLVLDPVLRRRRGDRAEQPAADGGADGQATNG